MCFLFVLIIFYLLLVSSSDCVRCWSKEEWPTGNEFNRYVPFFLSQSPNQKCMKAGLGQFDDAVRYELQEKEDSISITSKLIDN